MTQIKKAKPVKVSESYYFPIPIAFIKNKIINPEKEYDLLEITESSSGKEGDGS